MRIRTLAILLCALILVLAACSSSNGGGGSSSPTNETDAPTPAVNDDGEDPGEVEEEEDIYRTPEMDFDLGGRTIKVVSWWNMEIGEDNPDNIQRKQNLEALMEKHNFKMEYIEIEFGEYKEKVIASLLAGEPLGDIVRMGKNYTIPTLVKQDLLWPIDEYTKNPIAFKQDVTYEHFRYDDRGYGFNDQANLVQGIFYNRTLMNNLGMKPLQEYVDEDNWNWETFIQVAKEANQDTNNDGKLDTWGLARRSVLLYALYSNNTTLTVEDQQNLDDPATIEALNFASRIVTEQIGRPTEGGDWQEPGQFFRQGNTLMYPGAMYEIGGLKTDMPDYDIGFIPFPKGPNATQYHSLEADYQALTIPKSVDNPEQLMYIWEKINDIESIYDYPDQATLESNFSNEDDINNARMVEPNLVVMDHGTYPNFPYYDFEGELNEGISVSTVVEKYKAQFQSAIDEVWDQ